MVKELAKQRNEAVASAMEGWGKVVDKGLWQAPGFPEANIEETDAEQRQLDTEAYNKALAQDAARRRKRQLLGSSEGGAELGPSHGGKPQDTMVDPTKTLSSGMSIYDAGVEKVREEHGDEAAEAARQDMVNADYDRVIREHGKSERVSSDDYFDRVKTEDGQEWLIDDNNNVIRITGMSDKAVDEAYYSPLVEVSEVASELVPSWARGGS